MLLTLTIVMQLNAQTAKVDDKEIVGTWIMESMQWEGEKKTVCGKAMGYTQFKYYGADGEYAAAGIALSNDGKIAVIPQEYGKYSLKDGWYVEMGRPALKDAVILTDRTHYRGRWKNRTDSWVKHPSMSDKVVRYIVERCKTKDTPTEVQRLIKQDLFK